VDAHSNCAQTDNKASVSGPYSFDTDPDPAFLADIKPDPGF
jgi:hypothetical protein